MEYDLFTELYGREWNADATIMFDDEKKITEFDYENFLPPALLNQNKDFIKSPEFKKMIRVLNMVFPTEYEKFQ